jgi:hypothetical protein
MLIFLVAGVSRPLEPRSPSAAGAVSDPASSAVISEMLAETGLAEQAIADAADFMLRIVERYSGGESGCSSLIYEGGNA